MLERPCATHERNSTDSAAAERGWTARLELDFSDRAGQTYLSRRQHVGPLLVQRPFFPEPNACHVYVVHPPGGIAGGDDLTIAAQLHEGTHAVLTTPAATKFYRCASMRSQQRQQLIVDAEATLEWLPQESIFYRNANARSETTIRLARSSRFIGWEIPCFGLPARGERFDVGQLELCLDVWVEGEPRFIDHLHVDGGDPAMTAPWGFADYAAVGTLLAYPANEALVTLAREVAHESGEFAVTLVDEVLVCRCLNAQAEPVKRTFQQVWSRLRPLLLGREAVAPRIWAT